jgi:hypothetical protein
MSKFLVNPTLHLCRRLMVGTDLLHLRSQVPSPSSRLLHLPPKSSLLQSDQPKAVLNTKAEKDIGFSYRQVAVEFTHAYVVGRVGISDTVTLLPRYSSAPNRCHYLALKRLCRYLQRTVDWRSCTSEKRRDFLPTGDFKTLSFDNKDFPSF